MSRLPRPLAIIFDWDNTLVDTWPLIHDALNATLTEMGHAAWDFAQTKERVHKSMRDSFPALFGDEWEAAGERYRNHYRAHHLEKLQPLLQAEQVLQRVKEAGLLSVVVSNKLGASLRKEVQHLGWNGYFRALVGSDDARNDKPHEDAVHLALEKTGITPGRDVWFIGDSEVDLECAQQTGCTAVLFGEILSDHPQYTATHYYGFPFHAHVHNHAQLLALLDA